MTWEEFGALARRAFGRGFERTTSATVFEFCARTREQVFPSKREGDAYVITDEPVSDFDGITRSYFEAVLGLGPDHAAISLWLHAFEVWYGQRESDERALGELFPDDEPWDEPPQE